MKAIPLVFFLIIFSIPASFAQMKKKVPPEIKYNAEKAKKLGADELGMRNYVIGFMRAGPVKLTNSKEITVLRKAHLQNMQRLVSEGKLLVAGPFTDNKAWKGFYIFDVSSVEEAHILVVSDPAVKAGALILELHPWYGTAALKEIPDLHKQIQKKAFREGN
jgi:uncharacterized protein YciI